jgi:hypothetical protein
MHSHKSNLNQANALRYYFFMIENKTTTSYETKCKLLHHLVAIHKKVCHYKQALQFLYKLDTLYSIYDSGSHRQLHTHGLIAGIQNKVENEIKNNRENKRKNKINQQIATKRNLIHKK